MTLAPKKPRFRSLAAARAQAEAVFRGEAPATPTATTRKKPRHIESQHCRWLIQWRDHAKGADPRLAWLHAIPNGGARGGLEAKLLKAEGATAGVWDFFLPVSFLYYSDHAPGLYLEMKAPGEERTKNGGLSDNQVLFGRFVHDQSYITVVAYHWHDAREAVLAYLGNKRVPHLWEPPA